ncbi:MAG: DMT family transporter [Candidatus Altimarinota bacterium]
MSIRNKALIWTIIQIFQTASLILLTKHLFNLGIEPLNFSYQILLASAVYLFIFAVIKEPKAITKIDNKALLGLVLIGVVGGGITYGFGSLGLQKSTAVNYSFLIQTTILFTPVLAYFILKEHLKPYKLVLMLILLVGTYLISTNGALSLLSIGDLFILLSAVAFSLSVVFTKRALRKISTITFSMYRALFGGLSLLLYLLITNEIHLDFNGFWIIVVGFIIAIGIYAMNKVLEYTTASYMQMMYMMVPVITAISAYLLFGELMTPIQMLGGAIIITSGFLVHKFEI